MTPGNGPERSQEPICGPGMPPGSSSDPPEDRGSQGLYARPGGRHPSRGPLQPATQAEVDAAFEGIVRIERARPRPRPSWRERAVTVGVLLVGAAAFTAFWAGVAYGVWQFVKGGKP